jgi:hypothetical protein
MKHLQKFNELKLNTYAKVMDRTDNFPMKVSEPEVFSKIKSKNSLARHHFIKNWNDKYLNTKINFIGEKSNNKYEFFVYKLKFNTNYTNFDILVKDLNDNIIFIKPLLYFDNEPHFFKEKIKIDESSKELLLNMFDYGVQKENRVRRINKDYLKII